MPFPLTYVSEKGLFSGEINPACLGPKKSSPHLTAPKGDRHPSAFLIQVPCTISFLDTFEALNRAQGQCKKYGNLQILMGSLHSHFVARINYSDNTHIIRGRSTGQDDRTQWYLWLGYLETQRQRALFPISQLLPAPTVAIPWETISQDADAGADRADPSALGVSLWHSIS